MDRLSVDNLETLREFMLVSFDYRVAGNVSANFVRHIRKDLQNVHNVMCKY